MGLNDLPGPNDLLGPRASRPHECSSYR